MKILAQLFSAVLIFSSCLSLPTFAATATKTVAKQYEPLLKPGYRPETKTDEGGLWYQVDKFEKKIIESPHIIRDPALNDYVNQLTCTLAGEYCEYIRVYIVDNPHFNASMYPNGMMHVFTGLLLRVKSEAELAAVLSHELAHYLRTHQIQQWRKLKRSLNTAIFFDAFLTFGLATLSAASSGMSFSREQEIEADIYGLQLMTKAGYQPDAAAHLWQYVVEEEKGDTSKRKKSNFFATHPDPEYRIKAIQDYIAKQAPSTAQKVSNQERMLENIAPLYHKFMQKHIVLREFGRTERLLSLHEDVGYAPGWTNFFKAEMHRIRNKEGDTAKAIELYKKVLAEESPPVDAYRELGYLLVKLKDESFKHYLQLYLEKAPNADDRELVSYYLNSI